MKDVIVKLGVVTAASNGATNGATSNRATT
jgi:hypothetical protein